MEILIALIVLVFSAILHEIAHGYVADRLGDPTARIMGRLTLNPKPHIDPIMSIAVPLFLLLSGSPIIFGAAKPVPVDTFNLKEGRKDEALVALAGPATNLILAVSASLILKFLLLPQIAYLLPMGVVSFLYFILATIVTQNLVLGIINLLPIPPIDGSKIFSIFLPEATARRYLSLGTITGFALIFLLLSFSPLGGIISGLISFGRNILLP